MPGIRAGEMNRRGLIQDRSTSLDSFGGQLTTWADLATVWMSILPLSGRELEAAQKINTEISHAIKMRYDPRWADPVAMARRRIVFKGRYFNIHSSLNELEGNVEIIIGCSEGLNDG